MIRYALITALFCAMCSTACADDNQYGLPKVKPETVGLSSDRLKRIGDAFAQPIATKQIPGLITVVARKGKVVHFEMHGVADIDTKTLLTPDTIFRIYSMTKPIVGVGIMMLYEQGHFQLDDPVSRFIPAFANLKVHTDKGLADLNQPITIRQVMTHTSGLVDAYMPDPVSQQYKQAGLDAEWSTMASGITLEAYVQKMTEQPLLFQPGTRWHYGMNMTVLGRLIEIISKQSLGDYLQEHIFRPLGMKDTGYYASERQWPRLASIYKSEKGTLVNLNKSLAYNSKPSLELGDTGLVSTAIDYLRFTQMLLNGGELEGKRLLSPATVKLMRSNHLPNGLEENPLGVLKGYPVADRLGMGYGITVAVVTDAVAAGSAASDGEYTWGGAAGTEFWVDVENGIIGLAFTQLLGSWEVYPIRTKLHQLIYQSTSPRKLMETVDDD